MDPNYKESDWYKDYIKDIEKRNKFLDENLVDMLKSFLFRVLPAIALFVICTMSLIGGIIFLCK